MKSLLTFIDFDPWDEGSSFWNQMDREKLRLCRDGPLVAYTLHYALL